MSHQDERLLLQAVCYAGICDLWRRGIQPRVRDEAWLLGDFLCSKVLWKYLRARETSDIDIRRDRKSAPLIVFREVFYVCYKAVNQIERQLQPEGVSPGSSPTTCTFEIGCHEVCHPATIKHSTGILVCWAIIGLRFEKRKIKLVLGRITLKKADSKANV